MDKEIKDKLNQYLLYLLNDWKGNIKHFDIVKRDVVTRFNNASETLMDNPDAKLL